MHSYKHTCIHTFICIILTRVNTNNTPIIRVSHDTYFFFPVDISQRLSRAQTARSTCDWIMKWQQIWEQIVQTMCHCLRRISDNTNGKRIMISIHMCMCSFWTWSVWCWWSRWPKGKRSAFGALFSLAYPPHPRETGFEMSMSMGLRHHLRILLYLIQPHTEEPFHLPNSPRQFCDFFLADNISSAAYHKKLKWVTCFSNFKPKSLWFSGV